MPFYLFSDNCSEKEDFYFALLRNQEKAPGSLDNPPTPIQYEVKHIISLVQRLHSSEEHLQTRWINGLIGRLFLALYKTQEIENLIRAKITKKIARVKKPAFLTDIVIQKVDMGDGAPYITNPRLRDLTVDGDCAVEMDLTYTGNFRIEVAATARIELGSRFKAREVDLVLALVLKRLEGRGIFRFKAAPSNRIWFAFETMPKVEMSIEPIVSSRQITYNIILRAIESRIREVIAETLVVPHWDDTPFTDTEKQRYRGGIWADDQAPRETPSARPDEPAEEDVDRHEILTTSDASEVVPGISRASTGQTADSAPETASSASSQHTPDSPVRSAPKSGRANVPTGWQRPGGDRSPTVRVGSYTSSATPVVSTDRTTVDAVKRQAKPNTDRSDAASAMIAIASRSQTTSPVESPVGSPSRPGTHGASYSSTSSTESSHAPSKHVRTQSKSSLSSTPPAGAALAMTGFGNDSNHASPLRSHLRNGSREADKKNAIPSLSAATAAAKKWGWGVLARNSESAHVDAKGEAATKDGTPDQPIGRGRPLPPPGTPLPHPDKVGKARSAVLMVPRKPIPAQEGPDDGRLSPAIAPPAGIPPAGKPQDEGVDCSHRVIPSTSISANDGSDDLMHPMDLDDEDEDLRHTVPVASNADAEAAAATKARRGMRQRANVSFGREADMYPSLSRGGERRKSLPVVDLEKKQA
jgi:hypothetical protein